MQEEICVKGLCSRFSNAVVMGVKWGDLKVTNWEFLRHPPGGGKKTDSAMSMSGVFLLFTFLQRVRLRKLLLTTPDIS